MREAPLHAFPHSSHVLQHKAMAHKGQQARVCAVSCFLQFVLHYAVCPLLRRMLTHPVTGKPLLLGPAVGAKTSRLGNTSLGIFRVHHSSQLQLGTTAAVALSNSCCVAHTRLTPFASELHLLKTPTGIVSTPCC